MENTIPSFTSKEMVLEDRVYLNELRNLYSQREGDGRDSCALFGEGNHQGKTLPQEDYYSHQRTSRLLIFYFSYAQIL